MLSVKVAEDPESALLALWPRLQALAVEPVRGEEDQVDRAAFQGVAFEAQYRCGLAGVSLTRWYRVGTSTSSPWSGKLTCEQ